MIKTLLFSLFLGVFYFMYRVSPSSDCPFCNPKVIDRQKYYEDAQSIGLYSYKPLIEGHCLIIPKRHVERFEDLSSSEMIHLQNLIKKTHRASEKAFAAKSYLLLQKNGKEVGQSVPHVHFHYIPKKRGNPIEILLRFFFYPLKAEISSKELREKIKTIRSFWEHEELPGTTNRAVIYPWGGSKENKRTA